MSDTPEHSHTPDCYAHGCAFGFPISSELPIDDTVPELPTGKEIDQLKARVEELEKLANDAFKALSCEYVEDIHKIDVFDSSHWCPHCDEMVDRNATVRLAIREALR